MNMNLHNFMSYARLVCCFACGLLMVAGAVRSLPAQTAPDTQEAQKPEPEKKEEPKAAPAPKAPQAAPADGFKLGMYEGHSDIEIGYRWVSDTAGNKEMYRSMINLGEGPKVLHSSISLRSNYGTGILFDRFDLSFDNWGGEPYNTMRLNFGRTGAYEFRADYRNLNYYNFVPTWANPLLAQGYQYNQHSLDVTYRTTDLQLKLFPTHKVRPYFAYSRSTGFGPGFTTYSMTGNEFLLNMQWHYAADDYRGGVEISLPKLALTLEQGYRFLKNDTGATQQGGEPQGNHPLPYLGQSIVLNSLNRAYHDRTTLPVSKALVKFTPFENLKITGRYIYSMSDLESNMGEIDSGSLISLQKLISYRASADAFNTRAKQPNHNGSFLVEYSPVPELTILDQFDARSFHISGASVLASTFFGAHSLAGPYGDTSDQKITDLLGSLLAYDQIRNQAEIEGRLLWGLTARMGFRYTYAQTTLQSSENGDTSSNSASFVQRTGIIGFGMTRGQWLHLSLDYEKNLTNHALMRTDLLDFDQFKFDGKVTLAKKLSIDGRVAVLAHAKEDFPVDYKSHNHNYAVAVNYAASERFSVSLDYSRTSILSDIAILLPQTLRLDRSLFDERGHGIGGAMSIGLYRGSRIDFGYHGILNVGSYPLNYHQPYASVTVPLHDRLAFKSYWQYFGYNEKGSSLQDNRTHLVTVSLAYQY